MATRWGIVGSGKISQDFVNAFSIRPRSEHLPVAVAARSLESAQNFAKTHNVDKAYGSYQELAKDPDVEVAYIGVIAPLHLELTKMMLNAGKHVLCEKPLGMSLEQVEEMINLAKSKNLFFMEAIWSRTFPIYKKLRTCLDSEIIGEIKHCILTFGQEGNDVPARRLFHKKNGGGSILDWGVYCIQFCLLAFGGKAPSKVVANAVDINEDGVDLGVTVSLNFDGKGVATFSTDMRVNLPNRAVIAGRKGLITVGGPFWTPTTICVSSNENDDWCEDYPVPTGAKFPFHFVNSGSLVHEADHVRSCLKNNLKESTLVSHADSLLIAKIQKEIMQQIGVSYV